MTRMDKRGGAEIFFLPGDSREVAGVNNASIRYFFRDNGLCGVRVRWRQPFDSGEKEKLFAFLNRKWGGPDKITQGHYLWIAKSGHTVAEVSSEYDRNVPSAELLSLTIQKPHCMSVTAA